MLMTRAPRLTAQSMPLTMLSEVPSAELLASPNARTAMILAPGATPSSRSRETIAPAISVPCEGSPSVTPSVSSSSAIAPCSSVCRLSTAESIKAMVTPLPEAIACACGRCSLPIMYCAGSPVLAAAAAPCIRRN